MSLPMLRAAFVAFAGLPLAALAQSSTHASSTSTPSSIDPPSGSPDSTPGVLEPMLGTPPPSSQGHAESPALTPSFSRRDIADSTATDLAGLLSFAPGAQIVRNGGAGSNATLMLRGGSPTQSLVLIDGVRVDSVSLAQAQIAQLPLSQIDRVEVVNGDVSALYGSGAMGGVVQVFTKDGGNHPPRFHFSLGYGSYGTQTQEAGVEGAFDQDGRTTFSFNVSRFKNDGFSSIDPALAPNANPNANGYLNEAVSAMLRFSIERQRQFR